MQYRSTICPDKHVLFHPAYSKSVPFFLKKKNFIKTKTLLIFTRPWLFLIFWLALFTYFLTYFSYFNLLLFLFLFPNTYLLTYWLSLKIYLTRWLPGFPLMATPPPPTTQKISLFLLYAPAPPPLFCPKNIHAVNFMQFLAILPILGNPKCAYQNFW